MMCLEGQGVETDKQKAATYLAFAADQGVAAAQNTLAMLYLRGEGVEKNRETATMWLQLAADQGMESAQERLHLMNLSQTASVEFEFEGPTTFETAEAEAD